MADEEIEQELDAVMAVYGDDCTVLHRSPPHLLIKLKPRTADDISQQFVEALLSIRASPQYPEKPPYLELKENKGLDAKKISGLLSRLQFLAKDLISHPMLVALCEAASDKITDMNEPDGDCCFCMCPLVMEDESSKAVPFMKLVSCFHCFHSGCFGKWWRWRLKEKGLSWASLSSQSGLKDSSLEHELEKLLEQAQITCPVCRKSIEAEDLLSVKVFLTTQLCNEEIQEEVAMVESELLLNQHEITRKHEFNMLFRIQQLRGGIIEPKRLGVIVPGMYISRSSSSTISEEREEAYNESDGEQVLASNIASTNDDEMQPEISARPISMKYEPNRQARSEPNRQPLRGRKNNVGRTGQWIRRDKESISQPKG